MANVINGTSTGSGGLISTGDDSGILNIQTNETTAMSIDASQSVDFTNNIDAPNTFGFKNRLINSDMRIDQRNAGAVVTPTNGSYTLDRWAAYVSQASKITIQQNAGSVTPPAGFKNYLGITVGAAANVTVGAGDYFFIQQSIEGYNIADLGWGAAGASTITFSFWVRSSVTGTYGGALYNSGGSRSYPYSYVINSANTWEQKTVTVLGDTTGTWQSTTSAGIQLTFSLGTGSTYNGTAGSWAGATYYGTTGTATPITTNSATFYITGVQLEKGTQATSFDFRSITQELALCQRYYEKSYNQEVVPGTVSSLGQAGFGGSSTTTTTSFLGVASVQFAVVKRTTPTITAYDLTGASGVSTRFQLGVSSNNGQNWTVDSAGAKGFNSYSSGTSTSTGFIFQWTASAEL